VKYLLEVCEFMDIARTNPQSFVSHHLLSAYDFGIINKRLLPEYKVLYFWFLKQGRPDPIQRPPPEDL
jgi:hypothetical protein